MLKTYLIQYNKFLANDDYSDYVSYIQDELNILSSVDVLYILPLNNVYSNPDYLVIINTD